MSDELPDSADRLPADEVTQVAGHTSLGRTAVFSYDSQEAMGWPTPMERLFSREQEARSPGRHVGVYQGLALLALARQLRDARTPWAVVKVVRSWRHWLDNANLDPGHDLRPAHLGGPGPGKQGESA